MDTKFTLLLLLTLGFVTTAFLPNENWKSKVDESLLAKLEQGQSTDFLIVLQNQANLNQAKSLKTKEQKGTFVFNHLKDLATKSQQDVIQLLGKLNAPYQSFFVINAIHSEGDLNLVTQLAQLQSVASIQANPSVSLDNPVEKKSNSLNRRNNLTWGISRIQADQVWELGYNGQGVVVAGQDTGYEWDHPALIDNYRGWNGASADHNYNWHDAIHQISSQHSTDNPCGLDSAFPCDDNNHGTHTLGTVAGTVDSEGTSIGVAPGAKWMACRNMERGIGTPVTYIECFEFFLAPTNLNNTNPDPSKAPHVINNSWGCPESEGCNISNWSTMNTVISNLKAAGIMVVASAGNSGGQGCGSVNNPAAMFEPSFSIGATRSNDTIAGFSSRGPVMVDGSMRLKPNVAAPGVSVLSAIRNGGYSSFSGTSMAGPHVAGAVALIISANPALAGQVEEIEDILELTAKPMLSDQSCAPFSGMNVPNAVYGHGRIDVLAAVEEALSRVTSTEEIDPALGLKVYPNPFQSDITFEFESFSGDVQIVLWNAAGQQVAQVNWDVLAGEQRRLAVDAQAPGMYLYQIIQGNQILSGKLIKR